MCVRLHAIVTLAVLLLAGCTDGNLRLQNADYGLGPATEANPQSPDLPRPFFDTRSTEPNYAGPGREQADPPDVTEVLIGYFGPTSGSADAPFAFAGDMWRAACLAVEQANEEGGYRNKPFRLVSAWSDSPWGAGVKELTRRVFADKVWAVVGGIDGPTTHLAEQVAVKAGVPLLNPVSTDKTVNLINVPWIFSCTPQDHIQAQILADGLAARVGAGPFIVAAAVDHDSHLFAVEFEKTATARRLACAYSYQFDPRARDMKDLVERLCSAGSEAVVILAGAETSAQLVRCVREAGYSGWILGGPWMGQWAFVTAAGHDAEGVIFPCPYVAPPASSAFEKEFVRRFGRSPDYLAAHTYDAVDMLIAALRRAGLNRARIRDAIRELSPWQGVSGTIAWDAPGSNRRAVSLCTITDGRVVPLTPE